jgi:hypothetical protein
MNIIWREEVWYWSILTLDHSFCHHLRFYSSERVCLSYMWLYPKALLLDSHAMGFVRLSCLRLAKYRMGDLPNIWFIVQFNIMAHPTVMNWYYQTIIQELRGLGLEGTCCWGGGHSRRLTLNRANIFLGSLNFVKPILRLDDETNP